MTYDIRGNIQTLQRNGYNASNCSWGQIDNLTYQFVPNNQGYNPYNKVYSITDYADVSRGFITQSNGSAYSYDVDGNMIADPNKGITGITYNHLNLPEIITFTGNRTITFLYDAGGNKLRKTVVNNGATLYTQNYLKGIEYKNGALEAIYHSEGRVTTIDGILKYEYAMKDHLGNTRLMFCDRNGDGVIKPENAPEPSEVTQENSYYAFGMNMEFGAWENTPSVTDNLQQYNGKELNTDFGLNWNDYGRRMYDPTISRFVVMDRYTEKYPATNPYQYAGNNPIKNIDVNGDSIVVSGSESAKEALKGSIERGTEGHYQARIDKDGKLSLVASPLTTLAGKTEMSKLASNYFQVLSKAVSMKGEAKFNLVDKNDKLSTKIMIGDNGTIKESASPGVHTIDIGDIQNLGSSGIINEKGALVHEFMEGSLMQIKNMSAPDAHRAGQGYETFASGASELGLSIVRSPIQGNTIEVNLQDRNGNIRIVNINFNYSNQVKNVTNNK